MAATDSAPVTIRRADLKRLVIAVEDAWSDHQYAWGSPAHDRDMAAVRAAKEALGLKPDATVTPPRD